MDIWLFSPLQMSFMECAWLSMVDISLQISITNIVFILIINNYSPHKQFFFSKFVKQFVILAFSISHSYPSFPICHQVKYCLGMIMSFMPCQLGIKSSVINRLILFLQCNKILIDQNRSRYCKHF